MSLVTVCQEIAAVAGNPDSGIAVAFNEPPEDLGDSFPVSWVNPVSGDIEPSISDTVVRHRIELIVYAVPRDDNLPVEFARLAPLVDSVWKTFWRAYLQNEFSDTINRCWVSRYETGIRRFGSEPYHSVTFTIIVEEDEQ